MAQLADRVPRSRSRQVSIGALLNEGTNPLRAALNSLYTNCFVADLELNILFVNQLGQKTLRDLEPVMRRILRDPAQLPRTAVFSFGEITLRAHINAITDTVGTRLGTSSPGTT